MCRSPLLFQYGDVNYADGEPLIRHYTLITSYQFPASCFPYFTNTTHTGANTPLNVVFHVTMVTTLTFIFVLLLAGTKPTRDYKVIHTSRNLYDPISFWCCSHNKPEDLGRTIVGDIPAQSFDRPESFYWSNGTKYSKLILSEYISCLIQFWSP